MRTYLSSMHNAPQTAIKKVFKENQYENACRSGFGSWKTFRDHGS